MFMVTKFHQYYQQNEQSSFTTILEHNKDNEMWHGGGQAQKLHHKWVSWSVYQAWS